MLVDSVRIHVSGGKGGDGCRSMYKDLYNRKGVPDGGDGGNGGNVVIKADPNLNTLLKLRFNQHHKASDGTHGGSNNKRGRNGRDTIVKVPPGTVVRDAELDKVLRDLERPGESVTVARGGRGGRGNRNAGQAERGADGERRVLGLELKLVADVGVIGMPNAGKSTLVSSLSKARSKAAAYPFTTKSPVIGVVEGEEDGFVIADMPGLIEGAHSGRGLGDKFLRHIERTRVLLHLVDVMPVDGSDPADNYLAIENELGLYDERLFAKERVVAVNKMDLPGSEERFRAFREKLGIDALPVSAVTGLNLKELTRCLHAKLRDIKEEAAPPDSQDRYSRPYRQGEPDR